MSRFDEACSYVPPANQVVQNDNSLRKPHEKNVQFSNVVVYSFAREQGFSAIPTSGWCSLGMANQHFNVARYDVHHHQLLVKWRRRRLRTSSRNSFLFSIRKRKLRTAKSAHKEQMQNKVDPANYKQQECFALPACDARVPVLSSPPALSPQLKPLLDLPDNIETAKFTESLPTPPPPCLSPPSPRRVISHLGDPLYTPNFSFPSELLDTDSEASLDCVPGRSQYQTVRPRHQKLLPVQGPARIRLLKEAGVTELDESERKVCLQIRTSRARVGCDCAAGSLCVPDKCPCIRDGIQCQVDWTRFPCSCSAESCCNPNGRTEFCRERVRANILHVLNTVNERLSSPLLCATPKTANGVDDPSPMEPTVFPCTAAHQLTHNTGPNGNQHLSVQSLMRGPNSKESGRSRNTNSACQLIGDDSVSFIPTNANSDTAELSHTTRGAATPVRRVLLAKDQTSSSPCARISKAALPEPNHQILTVDPVLLQLDAVIKNEKPETSSRSPIQVDVQLDCPTSACTEFGDTPLTVRSATSGTALPPLCGVSDHPATISPINNRYASVKLKKTGVVTPSSTSFSRTPVSDHAISKHTPNYPCIDPRTSLSRLSLRRRAIQRLLVTPSRRVQQQQSNRSVNRIPAIASSPGDCCSNMDNSPFTTPPAASGHPILTIRRSPRTPLKASDENRFPSVQTPFPSAKGAIRPPSSMCRLPPD